ncbi:SIR2 family NAD-dependent protein deacylase [Sphingobacterium sp. HJSM2_6]|uniref:SIR2 family NAD-dependent protein deacylase n=1 Tax=Sphingobacterium sp. HJSM2_6 TaxID=3366264 RepID=UPI003BC4D7D0
MKKIVVFTGAGISAESGLPTFRGSDGLWEGYAIEDVATPDAWKKNPELVQQFYNQRRKDCMAAVPNEAHYKLKELEDDYDIQIITQNIDDLHERAGSSQVLHLHGQIRKSQSSINPNLIYDMDADTLSMNDLCELGSPLRPHVVWFGEAVPAMREASALVKQADALVVIGTSLQVYPAANLLHDVRHDAKIILIDPNAHQYSLATRVIRIAENASQGVNYLANLLAK